MEFYPRLTPPSKTDKYWIHTSKGGLNECVIINNTDGSVLPNCTGYAWGRTYEINKVRPKLSRGNAGTWFSYPDGYPRGNTPVVGAVACFESKDGGPGHVATVEEVLPDGGIRTSNSAFGGRRFYLQVHYPPYDDDFYKFQGFIYVYKNPTPPREYKKRRFPWVLYARKLRNRQLHM